MSSRLSEKSAFIRGTRGTDMTLSFQAVSIIERDGEQRTYQKEYEPSAQCVEVVIAVTQLTLARHRDGN